MPSIENRLWRFHGVAPTAWLAFVYLYLPIVILVVLSFNANKVATLWTGFSFDWYLRVLENDNILRATRNSLVVATGATVVSTFFATLAALAMASGPFRGKGVMNAMLGLPLLVPEIVTAVLPGAGAGTGADYGADRAHRVLPAICLSAHPCPARRA